MKLEALDWQRFGYGLGDFACNLIWQVISLYLLYFYTDVMQLSALSISGMFVVCRVIDGITDLLVGYAIDKTRTKWGKSRPVIHHPPAGMPSPPVIPVKWHERNQEVITMAITNSIENFEMIVNEDFVAKAEALTPKLVEKTVTPVRLVDIVPKGADYEARKAGSVSDLAQRPLGAEDSVCLDFGDHQVGYVSFRITPVGSPPDAPVYFRLKFGEIPYEIATNSADYHGSIAKGWIQEEILHIDVVPALIKLPRRYAFRYMELSVIDTSPKYKVVLSDVVCTSVSSADRSAVAPLNTADPELVRMDQVSLKTMEDCMQLVFEDGPKRDRRLWIGDLRLQALTNYETFRNNDLVKRCLYLFAGLAQNEGRVGACLFLKPQLQVDDTALFDYSLFFVSILHDYYQATGDRETLEELFPVADRQIELAVRELDTEGVVTDKDTWWCFLDWADGLNKQAGAQAVLIYTLDCAASAGLFPPERN